MRALSEESGLDGFNALLLALAPFLLQALELEVVEDKVGVVLVREWTVEPGAKEVEFVETKTVNSIERDAFTLPWEAVKQLCPAEAEAFEKLIEDLDVYDYQFAASYVPRGGVDLVAKALWPSADEGEIDHGREHSAEIIAAWQNLQQAFERAT
jgi:hypothetical protein